MCFACIVIASYSALYFLYFIGEPTIEEKAELFIEALNLGLPSSPQDLTTTKSHGEGGLTIVGSIILPDIDFEKTAASSAGAGVDVNDINSMNEDNITDLQIGSYNSSETNHEQLEKRSSKGFRGGGTSLKMQDGNSVSVREIKRCSPKSSICPFANST